MRIRGIYMKGEFQARARGATGARAAGMPVRSAASAAICDHSRASMPRHAAGVSATHARKETVFPVLNDPVKRSREWALTAAF